MISTNILATHSITELLLEPVVAFWFMMLVGVFLVVTPKRMTSFYPIDDRNLGLLLILLGSVYVQLTIVNPVSGLQNLTASLSQVGVFIGFVTIVIRNTLGLDW